MLRCFRNRRCNYIPNRGLLQPPVFKVGPVRCCNYIPNRGLLQPKLRTDHLTQVVTTSQIGVSYSFGSEVPEHLDVVTTSQIEVSYSHHLKNCLEAQVVTTSQIEVSYSGKKQMYLAALWRQGATHTFILFSNSYWLRA